MTSIKTKKKDKEIKIEQLPPMEIKKEDIPGLTSPRLTPIQYQP